MGGFSPQPEGTGPISPISSLLVASVTGYSSLLAPRTEKNWLPSPPSEVVLTGPSARGRVRLPYNRYLNAGGLVPAVAQPQGRRNRDAAVARARSLASLPTGQPQVPPQRRAQCLGGPTPRFFHPRCSATISWFSSEGIACSAEYTNGRSAPRWSSPGRPRSSRLVPCAAAAGQVGAGRFRNGRPSL